jgi:hypothetical protein
MSCVVWRRGLHVENLLSQLPSDDIDKSFSTKLRLRERICDEKPIFT